MARISSSKYKNGVLQATGNLDTVVAGTTTGGTAVALGQVRPGTLSAKYVVDAEATSLTMAAAWQVSADGTTWVDVALAPQNPAAVVLATGTGGADAAVTKVVEAPAAVYGWRFCRAAVVSAGATGTTSDTYDISYNYVAA